MESNILQGIRVLDFTRVLAGPYTTRLLADFGAEVIKVQSKKISTGSDSDESGYFNTWNRNKKSITLDLTFAEARQIALELVKISDVVIENFTPRVMSNFGLDFQTLKGVKPDLIMLSMSGMGQKGPWKDYAAFGPTVQALGGLTYMTSFDSQAPCGLGNSYADPIAGLYGAFAVLSAIEYRDKTGEGQYIDFSEYEAVCTSIGPAFLDMFANNRELVPRGNCSSHIPAAPYGCYRCLGDDMWCAIAVFDNAQWNALIKVMGKPKWANERRFSTFSERRTNLNALDELVGKWTIEHSAQRVVQLLQEAGVPSGVVQNAKDLANDPHLNAREFFVNLEHPLLGDTVSDRSPIMFTGESKKTWKSAPLLGEDNRYVYMDLLGFSEDKFALYVKKGVIR